MKRSKILTFCYTLLFFSGLQAQYDVYKLPYPINTDVYDEICPLLSYNEDELFFTRAGFEGFNRSLIENGKDLNKTLSEKAYNRRLKQVYEEIAGHKVSNPVASSFNQEIFFAKFADGEVYNTFHPGFPVNNALPNSICAHYGKDGSYVVINEFAMEGGMNTGFSYVHRMGKTEFTYPVPIVITDFEVVGSELNLAMSSDKSYIIISMEEEGSKQGKELYFSSLISEGIYSYPRKLAGINTRYDETTPYFAPDGKAFYFTSNRPGGMGGTDIYMTRRTSYSIDKWEKPVNLGPTINSKHNESYPYISRDGSSILFTTDRDGTSDIFYGVVQNIEDLEYSIDVNVILVDGEKRKKLPSEIVWGKANSMKYPNFFRTFSGTMAMTFETNETIKIKAKSRGKESEETLLDPVALQEEDVRSIEIEIYATPHEVASSTAHKSRVIKETKPKRLNKGEIPLEKHSTVVLKNIYFAKAKPDVLKASMPSIRELASALRNNPQAVIRIEGHTDNVGDKDALMELSRKRAEAIAHILIKEGIEKSQIKTRGYGDTRPITQNRSEKERAQNRRVEITVLEQ